MKKPKTKPAFAGPAGPETPAKIRSSRREAFLAMEQEQWDEYMNYIKRCGGGRGGVVKATRPARLNAKGSATAGAAGAENTNKG